MQRFLLALYIWIKRPPLVFLTLKVNEISSRNKTIYWGQGKSEATSGGFVQTLGLILCVSKHYLSLKHKDKVLDLVANSKMIISFPQNSFKSSYFIT